MKKNTIKIWIIKLLFCICVIVIYFMILNFNVIFKFFFNILKILRPFIIGGSIAFLFFPVCQKVEQLLLKTNKQFIKKRVRGLATGFVFILTLILFASIFFKIIPMLYEALIRFTQEISYNFEDFIILLEGKAKDIYFLKNLIEELKNQLSFEKLTKIFVSLDYKAYFGSIANIIFTIFNIFIGIIISIYIILERYNIKKTLIRISNITLRKEKTKQIVRFWKKTKKIIYTFIFGQIVDSFIVGCLIGSMLSLFRIENSVIFAAIYFVFAIIPYFGSIIAVILIATFSLVLGNFNNFLTVSIITIILQQLDSNFINPKIVGQAVGIKPLYVILGITLFGGIFGAIGLFLGPPLMSVCLEILDDIIKSEEIKKAKQKRNIKKNKVLKYFEDLN